MDREMEYQNRVFKDQCRGFPRQGDFIICSQSWKSSTKYCENIERYRQGMWCKIYIWKTHQEGHKK
ncbi:hypothetical protein HOLleu_03202 [Holothuria leucospilota]|uniref:Uncharacterized protein n=1 Tax=Holothuria leucospilota TaxID=206669 RepID=A0A9Q1CRN0_HOLLE|nr:hypothetical protein HOLleu_03202 [Holothuria leucospilota]